MVFRLYLVKQLFLTKWMQRTLYVKGIQIDIKYFYEYYQSRPIRNVTSVNCAIFNLYKRSASKYFYLAFDKVICNRNMQTFKETVEKIPESHALCEDLLDDLLMVTDLKW